MAARKRPLCCCVISYDGIAVTQISKFHSFAFVHNGQVYDQRLVIFADARHSTFAVLQSSVHADWVLVYCSSLETRPVYTPSDCYETFPLPDSRQMSTLSSIGKEYYIMRNKMLPSLKEGLRSAYNAMCDNTDLRASTQDLRLAQVQLDRAVVAAYGWDDLLEKLRHSFYPTKQGERFTIHPEARAEILARLLALNHERYAQKVAAGLHDKKIKAIAKKLKSAKSKTKSLPVSATTRMTEQQFDNASSSHILQRNRTVVHHLVIIRLTLFPHFAI